MAITEVNLGTLPDGVGGDTPRSAMVKINSNFTNRVNAASRQVGTEEGNVVEVGAFGLGKRSLMTDATVFKEGFYTTANGSENGAPPGSVAGYVDVKVAHDTLWATMHWFNIIDGKHWFKVRDNSGNVGTWQEYITSVNSQVDPNGFIKKASPIISLYADRIELNDEAKEQVNITYEKLDVGDYLIKGSTGFAQEGWYIETPKDANGNVLVAVVYEQLKNNDIRVKTYSKMVDKITGDIVPNTKEPKDIPPTRWIDIRLNKLPDITV